MKNGTFVIVEKDGKLVAAILRADGQHKHLEDLPVTHYLQKLNGEICKYLIRGNSKVVNIGGKNIYKQQRETIEKPKSTKPKHRPDWRNEMRMNTIINEPEIVEEMPKPGWSKTDSFRLQNARVPLDTKQVRIRSNEVDNFSLKLNQFAIFEEQYNDREKKWSRRFEFIRGKEFQIQTNFGKLFESDSQLADRQTAAAKNLFPEDGQLLTPKFKPEWRFVTGLGGHSVYETGITLHHIYGVPYIPASSIKGVLRSWIIYSKFRNNENGEEDLKNAEKRALQCEDFCHVFGCPAKSIFKEARQGKVTFFDALPTESPTIEPDVMTPHYSDWYGEKKDRNGNLIPPTDTQSPVPIFFLTVRNTLFQFIIGSKEWNLDTKTFWKKTLGWWLENALKEHGIGAKTTVGYGYMTQTK